MRVFFRIAVSMMHSVQNGITTRAEERGSLRDVCQKKEEPFPKTGHGKHLVRGITMQKEALAKQRQIPMQNEEDEDRYHEESGKGKEMKAVASNDACIRKYWSCHHFCSAFALG